MEFNKNRLLLAMAACMALGLSGCGGGDNNSSDNEGGISGLIDTGGSVDAADSGTGTTTTGSVVNPAHTIVLTYPFLGGIENLGNGVYRRKISAIVTDNEGNPVPDGTKVFLNVIDTVLAQGTITSEDGDGINAGVLTDVNPTLGDGTTATTFDTAYAVRNETNHYIHAGDHVFLTSNTFNPSVVSNSYAEDKNRVLDSWTANTLTVTNDYDNAYPDAIYASGVTDYVVGVSALGAFVLGKDAAASGDSSTADGGESVTSDSTPVNEGFATTKNGVAEFLLAYPANVHTINTGCTGSVDERVRPVGSARVYLVASAGTEATTIDQRFCFGSIADWVIDAYPSELSEGFNRVKLKVYDGGDQVRMPYTSISALLIKGEGDISAVFTDSNTGGGPPFYTNSQGWAEIDVVITDNSGDGSGGSVTIEFVSGDATFSYGVAIEDTSAP